MQNDEYKDPFAPDDENAGAGEPPPNQSRWDDVPDPFEDAEPKRRSYGENDRKGSANRSGQGSGSRKSTGSRSGGSSRARNNSDSGSKNGKKGGKTPVNLRESPSAKPVHRIVPCLMFAFAVFLFVCMFLHLIGGKNSNSAATHPVGVVGYGICFAFFGLFGGGGFLLPFLLGYLAVMWRRLLDGHKLIEKAVTSVLLQLLLSTFIHSCALGALEKADRYMTAGELIRVGAKMQGGGLFGGGIGYFLCSRMNIFGAIFITVLLLLIGIFFFIGKTPQHVIASIRAKIIIAKAKRKKDDTDEMDSAPIMDRMTRKHERAAGRRTDFEDDDMPEPPEGAVTYPNGKPAQRAVVRSKESPLLTDEDNPVPVMPILNASDDTPPDSPLFVPEEIGRELKKDPGKDQPGADIPEADRSGAPAKATPTAQNSAQSNVQSTAQSNAQSAAQPMRMRPPQVSATRQADSAAVDLVFPPQPNDRMNAARRVDLNWALSLSAVLTRRSRASACMCPCRPKCRFPALRRAGRVGSALRLSCAPRRGQRERWEQAERWQAYLQTVLSAQPIRMPVSARDNLPDSPGQCVRIPQTALLRRRTGWQERRTRRLPTEDCRYVRVRPSRANPLCGRQLPKDRKTTA